MLFDAPRNSLVLPHIIYLSVYYCSS